MKALDEIGWRRAARFGLFALAMVPYRLALVPPLRAAWLRLLGARVGRRTVLHDVRFFNLYRRGLAGLEIGDECFVGDECLLDLAEGIRLEPQVTLAERVLVLTHLNVGYRDHPLQPHFPATAAPVTVERGSFVGASVTILPGVRIGALSFVAARVAGIRAEEGRLAEERKRQDLDLLLRLIVQPQQDWTALQTGQYNANRAAGNQESAAKAAQYAELAKLIASFF